MSDITKDFVSFVDFCTKHGRALKNHREFASMVVQLDEKIEEHAARIMGYEMALAELLKAYPEDVLPDTTEKERFDVRDKFPWFIDRTSAMMGRHLARVIRERAAWFTSEIMERNLE